MAVHPIEAVVIDNVEVDKEPFREEIRQYLREFLTAVNFRTYDLPNTPNALIDGVLFSYDAADLTTADNGVSCVHDASARRFKTVPVSIPSNRYIGITVGGTAQAITIATSQALSSITQYSTVLWKAAANITGANPTAAVDTVSALPIKSPTGGSLAAYEIHANGWYEMMAMGGVIPTEYWLVMGYE